MTAAPAAGADPLAPLAGLPGVPEAVERARDACERLRWHEGFRRRWREVRAEADVRSAWGSARLDGARVPLERVRASAVGLGRDDAAPGGPVPAELRVATGALRVVVESGRWRGDLGGRARVVLPPFGQLLARLHTAATAGWLDPALVGVLRTSAPSTELTGLGPVPTGPEVSERMELLGRLLATSRAPALVVAAVVHGELLALRPFAAGNALVARALFRLLVTTRGLDPTGSVVPELRWSSTPNPYLAAAAGFATGSTDGVAGWIGMCADGVVAGCDEATVVADAVLAGRLG
ncbi:cell filamentation protein Fic [Cellulomonas hominis]